MAKFWHRFFNGSSFEKWQSLHQQMVKLSQTKFDWISFCYNKIREENNNRVYFLTILLLFCNYFISTHFAHSNYLQSCNGRIYESYLPAISKNLGSFRGFFLLFSYYWLIDNQILLLFLLFLLFLLLFYYYANIPHIVCSEINAE